MSILQLGREGSAQSGEQGLGWDVGVLVFFPALL